MALDPAIFNSPIGRAAISRGDSRRVPRALGPREAVLQQDLPARLQALADALEEAIDHIETLEAIVAALEKVHPEAVDRARASVAAGKKDQHF